jgi:hypothetical protein
MTIHDLTALSFFGMAQAVTFAAGLVVGLKLSRKDVRNDDSDKDQTKDPDWWHTVGGERPRCRAASGCGRSADAKPEADSRQRADR